MANGNRTVDEAEEIKPRSTTADGAFDVAAPKIPVEDLTDYGSRFAHDEHQPGFSQIEPDGVAAIEENNRDQPWDLSRIGRVAAYAIAGAGVHRLVSRMTRRQRRMSVMSVLGAAAVAIGVGTWLARRDA